MQRFRGGAVKPQSKSPLTTTRQSRNQTGVVGAPLVGALVVGTHEGCPYETRSAALWIFFAASGRR